MQNYLQQVIAHYPEEIQDQLILAVQQEAKRILAQEVHLNGKSSTQILQLAPPLPAAARLSDEALKQAEQVGQWLTTYTDYASQRSLMTPRSFHESGGLWLGSVAIARRLYLPMPFADIFPNLYILWVADTTLHRKTTALKIVEEIAHLALNHLLLPQEFTPEALLAELAGNDPPGLEDAPDNLRDLWLARRNFAAQRGLIMDEFSGIMASARKDYNAGLTEMLLRMYDCPLSWERRTQTHGTVRVRLPYIPLLSATTPAALAPFLARGAWLSGFWPRFALLSPETARPVWQVSSSRPARPAWLIERLTELACKLLPIPIFPEPPTARKVQIDSEAYEAWERYSKAVGYDILTDNLDKSFWGLYGRLPVHGLKVAIILAALDWDGQDDPVVTLGHWAKAQQIVEDWRESTHRLLVPAKAQEEQQFESKLIEIIGRVGSEGMTAREVSQFAHSPRSEVEPVLDRLVRDEILHSYTPKGGRAKRYCKP